MERRWSEIFIGSDWNGGWSLGPNLLVLNERAEPKTPHRKIAITKSWHMHRISDSGMSKVPEVTLAFWVIKVLATTLGETGGDALSMTMNLGYAVSSVIFFGFFVVTLVAQVASKELRPFLYWAVIVATTTAGTTMADFADRSLGIGYIGGSLTLVAALMIVLGIWRLVVGSVSISEITSRRVEMFYWVTILFSNTLGTALGHSFADTSGLGYEGAALVFTGALVLIAAAYFFTNLSHTLVFWSAFILTRPLGAALGDLLTKPVAQGGLHLSRISSSVIIVALIVACVMLTSQRRGERVVEER